MTWRVVWSFFWAFPLSGGGHGPMRVIVAEERKEGMDELKGNMEVSNASVIAETVPFGKEQVIGEPCRGIELKEL
jgi:hypothetical protein